jgi:hypothetical protein
LLGGISDKTNDNKGINVFWGDIIAGDAFDFGTIVRRGDKVAIGSIDTNIELGNKENQTLVDFLGGKIKLGYNLLYDKSITDGDGDIVKQLGVDSDFQVDGRIEAVSGISVGQDGLLITKELATGGKPFGQVDAQNELRFVSPVVNVTNVLGLNQITGINGLGVDVNAPFTFNQPIYVLPSNNPNSPITNAQFNTALSGGFAVSTTCKLLFVTNQTLSGAKTQGVYTTVTGDSILLNGQTTASENGIYVFDGTNWTRNTSNDTSAEIRGKGHLILNGTYASTQWVNNNPADITLGTTAITYTQWSGAELDPIFTNHAAFNVTNAKIASWDLVSSYGTHLGLYVDLVSNQSNIGGAKKFTASVQSPVIKAGSDSLNITMFNYFGTAPRIASNSNLLDFFANTNFTWTTSGDLGRMKLNATGLRVGSTTDPLFKLHISGTTGFEGLISVGNTSQGIAMSSGTTGQFLRRSNVSNGFYNVDVNRWENFGEFGQFQTHAQFGNISALPWGTSFVNGTTTGLPNAGLQAHVMKMSIGSEYPDQATYLAIPRPFANYFDGQIYVRGIYGTADSGWISVGGGNFKDYDFDEYEATIKYHGYFYNNTPEGREGFIGFNRLDGGVILEYKYTEIDSNVTTTYRNIMNSDGRLAYQIGNGEAKKYALYEEIGTGGVGVTYSPVEPIFFTGNTINVRTASATQNGVLTKENWTTFNNKQNTLLKASASQDGYLSKEDFATFLANTGGGGTTYSFTEPLYLDGTVKVRVASATQNGVLTKEDWAIFNGKQNTLLKASATQDGYLSKEDFSTFLASTGGGSGVTYTFTDPIYLDGTAVKIKVATSLQNGVLTKEDWAIFNNKQNTLAKASATQDGYLSKEDFSTFLAGTGGGTTYSFANPLYLSGNEVNIYTASATQNGALTKEDWSIFNGKQNTLLKASSTQDGYLSKEDFTTFLAGTGSGVSYTLAEPLFFINNQINIKTASATQTGVLSSTKFTEFNAKFGEGSYVTTSLNFQTNSYINFNYNSSTANGFIRFLSNALWINSKLDLFIGSSDGTVKINRGLPPTQPTVSFTDVQMGNNLLNSILEFNGTNFNFQTTTTPTNGQKFLLQYNSSKNTFFFVPA